jgi:hypothetical protein
LRLGYAVLAAGKSSKGTWRICGILVAFRGILQFLMGQRHDKRPKNLFPKNILYSSA